MVIAARAIASKVDADGFALARRARPTVNARASIVSMVSVPGAVETGIATLLPQSVNWVSVWSAGERPSVSQKTKGVSLRCARVERISVAGETLQFVAPFSAR